MKGNSLLDRAPSPTATAGHGCVNVTMQSGLSPSQSRISGSLPLSNNIQQHGHARVESKSYHA